jgi:trehalose-phosphatase
MQPTVLVACDYDGTLAVLVDDPERAIPNARSIGALRTIARLPATHVALVSGRALADLVILSGLADTARLVGSHGSEFEVGVIVGLEPDDKDLLERLCASVVALAGDATGARIERKPASVAFHTREVDPVVVPDLVSSVLMGPGSMPGVSVKHGKDVIELTVVDTHKGTALRQLRDEMGADAVVFIGDDLTDEDAFTVLGPGDLGVKVGAGATMADHRVADVDEVADLLELLAARRGDQPVR